MWNNTKGEQDNLCLALINPRLCKKLSIKVAVEQHDTKTTVPYLHVFLDNTWNLKNCAFIRLDKPEYVPEKNSKRLSTKQKEELIYILTRECNGNWIATVYKGNIIKNLIMDCQSYTKYRPNETTGGIFVSWRRKEELPTGA